MTTATDSDESRLGRLEGQMEQMVIALQDVRSELRSVNHRMDQGFQEIRGEVENFRQEIRGEVENFRQEIRGEVGNFRQEIRGVNARIPPRPGSMG